MIMKRKISSILIIFTLSTFFIIGCYDDKGNYDYVDVNALEVINSGYFGEKKDSVLSVLSKVDTLKISPDVISIINTPIDESQISYRWYYIKYELGVSTEKGHLIEGATSKELVLPIDLPSTLYRFMVVVSDTSTGIECSGSWLVNVSDLMSNGLMLLCESLEGTTQIDMIAFAGKDTVILSNLNESMGLPKLGKPTCIFKGPLYSVPNLYICTDNGQNPVLDQVDLSYNEKNGDIRYMLLDMLDSYVVTDFKDIYRNRYLIVDGKFYFSDLYSNGICGYPSNRYTGQLGTFPIAPTFAVNYEGRVTSAVCYDTNAKRFAFSKANGLTMDSLKNTPSDVTIFDWKTNLDFVANICSFAGSGDSFTILKNNQGGYFLYRYLLAASSVSKKGFYDISNAKNIDKAKFFCISAEQPYMFYAVGSVVYGYDFQNGRANSFEMDMGHEISMMNDLIYRGGEPGKDFIYIATHNGADEGGVIEKFHILNDPNSTKLEKTEVKWEGLAKVMGLTIQSVN